MHVHPFVVLSNLLKDSRKENDVVPPYGPWNALPVDGGAISDAGPSPTLS